MKCLDNMEDKNVVILLLRCKINALCINVKQVRIGSKAASLKRHDIVTLTNFDVQITISFM